MASDNLVRLPSIRSLTWDDCRLLVESVVDYAIFMLDAEGRVATWNIGAQKIKGYRAEEIVGQHFSKFFPDEDIAAGKPQRELEIAAREGRVEDEGWRIRKDGSRFWASVVVTALRDDAGNLRGFGKVTRDLTSRRAAEEELHRSEQRFHHLVDAVIDYAIFSLDATGHVATWNPGARRVKGYVPEEIIGKHFSVFYTDEDRAAGRPERILEQVRQEGRFEEEAWRVRKDGSHFWASVVITALRDEGKLVGFAKVTRDLTSRREAAERERLLSLEQTKREVAEQAERELRALSARLEIVLEGVADGITVQDRMGRVVFANTAAAKMCGFATGQELTSTPPEQVVARFEIAGEDGRPLEARELPGRRVLAGEGANSRVLQIREKKSGRISYVSLRANAVLDAEGRPELAINIWHDVTAKRAEELEEHYLAKATTALGSSLAYTEMLSELAQALVPGLGDGCTIHLVEEDQVRTVAVAFKESGRPAEDARGRELFDPLHDGGFRDVIRSGKSRVLNDLADESLARDSIDRNTVESLKALGVRAQMLVPILVREQTIGVISLVLTQQRSHYGVRDVVLAEELARRAGIALENARLYEAAHVAAKDADRAARAAEQASRAKDEFLAVVSHELRTPLNAIMGWAKLLNSREYDEGKRNAALATIERNAVSMAQLIEDLLDMSRVISGKMRLDVSLVDLGQVIEAALDSVSPAALAKGIELVPVLQAPAPPVLGDATRLQQIVWNLLSNAVKFSSKGGRVQVALRRTASRVEIIVKDTGKGISREFLRSVFDPFRQEDASASRSKGGLGLGLAITRQLVELHGGKISAESQGEGCGATFTVSLPLASVAPPDPWRNVPARSFQSSADFERPEHLRGLRILIVDDEDDSRSLVGAILQECGCEVISASSAQDALREMAARVPDLLVSDIGMPDEDGYELIRKVRALPRDRGGDIPAAALTAYARAEDRQRMLNAGYSIHLAKPVEPAELVAVVATLSRFLNR